MTAATVTMFGIPNCDTIKKARKWLYDHKVDHAFHDYKKAGVDEKRLQTWVNELGWEALLNKSGTTFRKLPDEQKHDLVADKAIALMIANPSMIRRPILDLGDRKIVGFTPDLYANVFS